MLLYDPIRFPDDHQFWDVAFKDACCSGINSYCHKYFERRPISTCDNYSPPDIGEYIIRVMMSLQHDHQY